MNSFGQQLISFYSCQVYDPTINASIPTTTYATVGWGSHTGAGLSSLLAGSSSSVNLGIYSNDPQNVIFSCPTGNCTYSGTYVTAGWCSSCEDVTDQLKASAVNGSWAGSNYTLLSTGLTASSAYMQNFKVGVDMGSDLWGVRIQAIVGTEPNLTQTPWGIRGYRAADCTFAACAQVPTGNISQGEVSESIVETSTLAASEDIESEGDTYTIYVPCLNNSERQTVIDQGWQLEDGNTTTWLPSYNLADNSDTTSTIRQQCIYYSNTTDPLSLQVYLSSLFEGSISTQDGIQGSNVLTAIFNNYNVTSATINDTMSRVAQSLSAWGRTNAAENLQTLVSGKTYRNETCVAVGWWWLAYPIVLSVATRLFLV